MSDCVGPGVSTTYHLRRHRPEVLKVGGRLQDDDPVVLRLDVGHARYTSGTLPPSPGSSLTSRRAGPTSKMAVRPMSTLPREW
jgi:hypothetical protein